MMAGCGHAKIMREDCAPEDVYPLVDAMLDPARPDTLTDAARREDELKILRTSLE